MVVNGKGGGSRNDGAYQSYARYILGTNVIASVPNAKHPSNKALIIICRRNSVHCATFDWATEPSGLTYFPQQVNRTPAIEAPILTFDQSHILGGVDKHASQLTIE